MWEATHTHTDRGRERERQGHGDQPSHGGFK